MILASVNKTTKRLWTGKVETITIVREITQETGIPLLTKNIVAISTP